MSFARFPACFVCAAVLCSAPAFASHLVTGNGFGFAVVSPDNGTVTKFYAHPYSFGGPDPGNPLSEGLETANFIKQIDFSGQPSSGPSSAEYVQDSQIVRIRRSNGQGLVFMPFGLPWTALIVSWEPTSTQERRRGLQVEWSHPVESRTLLSSPRLGMQVLKFQRIEESLLLIPLAPRSVKSGPVESGPVESAMPAQDLSTSQSWALISLEDANDAERAAAEFNRWRDGLSASALATREMAQLEQWRAKPAVHFTSEEERHLWRQSEVMLRMAQSREPNRPGRNNNGLIVAALPDGVYFTPWVRDMAWALVAFIRMGHRAEARAGLLAYFNARPTGKMRADTAGADYQVSVVRYFGDGSEEPFFTQEGATNIEFDDWGLALWALGQYLRTYNDPALLKIRTWRGPLYQSAKDLIVAPLLANTEPFGPGKIVAADTSIWEEHQKDRKHFAWSTAMAIAGLEKFAEVARLAGDEPARTQAINQAGLLRKGFTAAFVRDGQLHGTLEPGEKNDIDGALLVIINLGLVTDPALIRSTVDRMELLKVASGGYKRVRSNYADPAIFEYWYEKQEFLFVDFSLAEVDRRLGKSAEGDSILRRIVSKAAADHNIIPEMYVSVPCPLFPGKIGDATGALPMVGYGAGEYILHLIAREALENSH